MKKKSNLLVISHLYPSEDLPQHGIFFVRQAEYLRRQAIESFFLVPRPMALWPMYRFAQWRRYRPENKLLDHGFELKETRYLRPPGVRFRLWEDAFMYRSLRKCAAAWHRQMRFDAVLGVSLLPDAGAAAMLGRELKIPSVGLAIGSDVKVYPNAEPRLKKKLASVIGRLDRIVGVSGEICDCIKAAGTPRSEPETVYLGRDTSLFYPPDDKNSYRRPLNIPADATVGIYVGNIIPTKGMNELAEILPALFKVYPRFFMIIVGNGPSRAVFESLREQFPNIILPGNLPPQVVADYLKCSDFMIFPSYSEGMPQAVLEAMNCRLAVIASRVGGIPEAVIDGQTGLLVDPQNADQLHTAIDTLLTNDTLRRELSENAAAYCNQKFDPDKNAEYFSKCLYSLIQEHK